MGGIVRAHLPHIIYLLVISGTVQQIIELPMNPTDYSWDFSSHSYVGAFKFFPRCSLSHGNGGLAIFYTSMKCGRDFYILPTEVQENENMGPRDSL